MSKLGLMQVCRGERVWHLVLALISMADAAVTIGTLGHMTTAWRAWHIFGDAADE